MSKWIDHNAIDYRSDRLHDKSEEFLNGVIYMAQRIEDAPSIDIVRCKECRYFYTEERFGETVHFCKHFNDVRGYWAKINADDFCSYGCRSEKPNKSEIPTGSEKPNNCEHITEDGVTCAKYPACNDCPDNPLSKVKGSERLVKGKDEPHMGDAKPIPLSNRVTPTEPTCSKMEIVEPTAFALGMSLTNLIWAIANKK